jgi:glycosyltransferase involved in cell wall biosynthesis
MSFSAGFEQGVFPHRLPGLVPLFYLLIHRAPQVVASLIASAWLFKFFETVRGLSRVPNLAGAEYDCASPRGPILTVIVPARNEAKNIGACLESLLNQDYLNLRIVAVDDRSDDSTGAVMDALAARYPTKLDVIHVSELPRKWLGKTHAMAMAARRSIDQYSSDYLLFTDADVVFHPGILRRALAYCVSTRADHLVVLPTTAVKSRGEGMLLGYLQAMSFWAIRPWRVADPKAARDAIGVGAFNLIRVPAYQQIGGFDAFPMEIVEDMMLGRRVKRAGLRQRVANAPGMVSVHWAPGMLGIVNGLTKNIFASFGFRWWLLLAAAAGLALGCIAPVVFLALPGTAIPAVLTLAAVVGIYTLSSWTSGISPGYSALLPVAAALVIYAMLRSMAVTLASGGVTWRGTFYPLAELRQRTNWKVGE